MRQIIISLCSALASATLLADPIHDAVLQGQLEQVETILKQTPAAARARDANGNTPLHLAAAAGNADIAELLLDGWAEINAVNNAGDTPLLVALNNEENPVIPLLLKKKPNLTITGAGDTTPLQRAAWNGLKNAYRMLLDAGAQPDIFSAVALGDTAVAAGLIRSNSTVLKQIGPHGGTPLHWAAARGNAATIQLLLSHNANPRTVGSDGATAFHWAAIHNNTETLSALLKQFPHLADITDNFTKTTPLQSAAAGGHTPVMQLLLQHGARLTHRNLTGFTALHFAARFGHPDAARLLLAKGADVNVRDNEGHTPLHAAVLSKNTEVVELILAHKANPMAKTRKGETPLDLADAETGRLIVPHLPPEADISILYWAVAHSEAETLSKLIQRNPTLLRYQDKRRPPPLHIAAQRGNSLIAELLLSKGADINAPDTAGNTPLHVAVTAGQKAMVELLLAKGANINARGAKSLTPLQAAVEAKQTEIIALLRDKGAR